MKTTEKKERFISSWKHVEHGATSVEYIKLVAIANSVIGRLIEYLQILYSHIGAHRSGWRRHDIFKGEALRMLENNPHADLQDIEEEIWNLKTRKAKQ